MPDNPITTWAEKVLSSDPLFLDTETTGIGPFDEPLQIAIMDSNGRTLFDSRIKPVKAKVHPDAFAVHGLEVSEDNPTLADIYDELARIINGRVIVAYNAGFDRDILRAGCLANEKPSLVTTCKWVDLMQPYAAYYGQRGRRGEYRWQRLTAACQQQGIEVSEAHTAVGDCKMSLALLRKMADAQPVI